MNKGILKYSSIKSLFLWAFFVIHNESVAIKTPRQYIKEQTGTALAKIIPWSMYQEKGKRDNISPEKMNIVQAEWNYFNKQYNDLIDNANSLDKRIKEVQRERAGKGIKERVKETVFSTRIADLELQKKGIYKRANSIVKQAKKLYDEPFDPLKVINDALKDIDPSFLLLKKVGIVTDLSENTLGMIKLIDKALVRMYKKMSYLLQANQIEQILEVEPKVSDVFDVLQKKKMVLENLSISVDDVAKKYRDKLKNIVLKSVGAKEAFDKQIEAATASLEIPSNKDEMSDYPELSEE